MRRNSNKKSQWRKIASTAKQAPARAETPSRSNTDAGFATVSLLLILPLLLTVILGGSALALYEQRRLALWSRLDVCAVETMDQRIALLKNLNKTNAAMTPLRYAIYAARDLAWVPVAGQVAVVSEKVALVMIHGLARWQDLSINAARLREPPRYLCQKDRFSKEPAHCQFPAITLPERELGLYPDVPGNLNLGTLEEFQVSCRPLLHAQIFGEPQTTLSLKSGETYYYEYKN